MPSMKKRVAVKCATDGCTNTVVHVAGEPRSSLCEPCLQRVYEQAMGRVNDFQVGQEGAGAPTPCTSSLHSDTGAHYRYAYRARITDEDIARGFVEVKLDPYRIAAIYDLGGGPREHIVKKGLRGTAKGDSERDLIRQLRDALNRWEEMLDEDEGVPCR